MVLGLPLQPSLVGTWLPDRVGAFLVAFIVLALPWCTETERDFLSFLALEPGRGLGCGYVGLIVSSWSALTREGWASAARLAAGRVRHGKAIRSHVSGQTGLGVCAALGGVLKCAQIGSYDFGAEVSGDSGGLWSYRHRL